MSIVIGKQPWENALRNSKEKEKTFRSKARMILKYRRDGGNGCRKLRSKEERGKMKWKHCRSSKLRTGFSKVAYSPKSCNYFSIDAGNKNK